MDVGSYCLPVYYDEHWYHQTSRVSELPQEVREGGKDEGRGGREGGRDEGRGGREGGMNGREGGSEG